MSHRPTLRYGSSGEHVRYLQEFLQREFSGSMTIPPDVTGTFDAETVAVVRAFQEAYGLDEVDGAVGSETWAVIEEVDPRKWEVGSDMRPMEMAPLLLAEEHQVASDGAADRQSLNTTFNECTTNWETWPLLPVVGARFAAEVGYQLEAFERDATLGYDAAVLHAWLAAYNAVVVETCNELLVGAGVARDAIANTRDRWPDPSGGVTGAIADVLGVAYEPEIEMLDVANGHVTACEGFASERRPLSAAGSLADALNQLSATTDAWLAYFRARMGGLKDFQQGLDVTEAVAKEILLSAATGGVGRALQVSGRLAKASVALGVRFVGGATLSITELGFHVLHGTDDQFDLDAALKKALRDAAVDGFGEAASGLVAFLPAEDWIVARFAGELDDSLAKHVAGFDRRHGLSGRVLRLLGGTMAEAAVATAVEGIADGKIDGTRDLLHRVLANYASEGWKNVVGGTVDKLADAPAEKLEKELVNVLRAEMSLRAFAR